MKKILFFHATTLNSKVTIPLVIRLVEEGYAVSYRITRPNLLGFSAREIKSNPTGVATINRKSLEYVSRLINYHHEFSSVSGKVSYVIRVRSYQDFDAVVSVAKTSRIDNLRRINSKFGVAAFALGYQHFPFFVKVNSDFRTHSTGKERDSVFFRDNPFTQHHEFAGFSPSTDGLRFCCFTYLDKVYRDLSNSIHSSKSGSPNTVLVFHPGGYRGVVTQYGDSKRTSYAKQSAFIKKVCIPLVHSGFRPVIKVHPLRARYHDLSDLSEIISSLEKDYSLESGSICCIAADSWYWQYAFESSFILVFGSSSLYELWSTGLKNVFVCNFEGKERSKKFGCFESVFINTYEEYLEFIRTEAFQYTEFDPLTSQVFDAYHSLFNGQATQTAYELISNELRA
jgi:hypothetical protein